MKKKFHLEVEDNFIDLINKMLEPDANKRISLSEILEHSYIKNSDELNESIDD